MQKDIRTRITDTINERQLTRKDLAELIGSSQSTVTKILGRFIENPKKETLIAMCDKSNCYQRLYSSAVGTETAGRESQSACTAS